MEAMQHFKMFFDFFCHHRVDANGGPNPFKINTFKQRLCILKMILILIMCLLSAAYAVSFADLFIPNHSCVNRLVNWMFLCTSLAACFVVTWEKLAVGREDVHLWNTFNEIEIQITDIADKRVLQKILTKYNRLYSVLCCILLTVECSIVLLISADSKNTKTSTIGFIILFQIMSVVDIYRQLQMTMYIRILTSYLRILKLGIKQSCILIHKLGNHGLCIGNMDVELRKACSCYFLCMKAFLQIQNQFSWGLFMICLKFSIVLWNETYWIVFRAFMETSFKTYCLHVIPYFIVFLYFTWSCEWLYAEVNFSQPLYTTDLQNAPKATRLRITHLQLLLDYNVFFFHTFGVCRVCYKLVVQYIISGITRVSFIAEILVDYSRDN
ncbi:uncharacterized protein LOC131293112 [Anopheles ziemanni]|uniref:uncharacterized protein LOC131264036 n=1 Tax=Anopheles coustani TaxID=139045 RepID=UPI0026581577|nr:uncharacterized protein LOC131264036 [Anopheles coustani]XP_058177174.1 uncharacterized protein LOC131293112 [Anopheles ziemanni]